VATQTAAPSAPSIVTAPSGRGPRRPGRPARHDATGRPVVRSGSVTVVGPDLVWADIWATAAWVDPHEAARLMSRTHPDHRLLRHP
jgi:hypothetical protein